MAEPQGAGAGGQVLSEEDFELVIDPQDMKGWRPFLMQALAIAEGQVQCDGVRAEVCFQAFLDALEELRHGHGSGPKPEDNRGSG